MKNKYPEYYRGFDWEWVIPQWRKRRRYELTYIDPIYGRYCTGDRTNFPYPTDFQSHVLLPIEMLYDPDYSPYLSDLAKWQVIRYRYDFEYWLSTCVTFRATDAAYKPILAEWRIVDVLENARRDGHSVQALAIRCLPWAGSTILRLYFTWLRTSGTARVALDSPGYALPIYVEFEVDDIVMPEHLLWIPSPDCLSPFSPLSPEVLHHEVSVSIVFFITPFYFYLFLIVYAHIHGVLVRCAVCCIHGPPLRHVLLAVLRPPPLSSRLQRVL